MKVVTWSYHQIFKLNVAGEINSLLSQAPTLCPQRGQVCCWRPLISS